jgi:germination protein M
MLLALMSLVGGCSFWKREAVTPDPPKEDRPSNNVQMRETVFYYPDGEWKFVVPVRFNIPWQEGIARATINCMIAGQVPPELHAAGFSPLLPVGTEILGLTIKDGLARIDFNRSFLDYNPAHERVLLDGLVYTLTEFPTVNRVEIMVDGEKLTKLPGGESLSEPLNRERGVNLTVSGDVTDFAVTDRVVLFFLHSGGGKTFFVPVTRVIKPAENKLEASFIELLRGPAHGSRLYSAIPRGVYLEKATVSGNRATIRINGDITATGGGQAAADHMRDQFALTLANLVNVTEIEVLAAGRVPQFPGGVTFPEVFAKPKTWNKIAETAQPDKR